MEPELYLAFVLLSFMVIVVPGPNVLVIVSTSIAHGKRRGLQTVVGTSLAMALQLLVTVVGTTWIVQMLTDGFIVLKWLGMTYLLYLGIVHLRQAFGRSGGSGEQSASASITRGFLVSLTNPKTILFFSAFFPQFINESGAFLPQICLLSLSFLVMAVLLDSAYAILAARLKPLLERGNRKMYQHGISGVLYLGASAWLAMSRRGQ